MRSYLWITWPRGRGPAPMLYGLRSCMRRLRQPCGELFPRRPRADKKGPATGGAKVKRRALLPGVPCSEEEHPATLSGLCEFSL